MLLNVCNRRFVCFNDASTTESYSYLLTLTLHDALPICLAHPKPHESDGLEAFFGCPVAYGQPEDMIIFARADLDRPILVADEELASLLDGVANRDRKSTRLNSSH